MIAHRAQLSVGVALSGFLSRKRKYADETRGRLRQGLPKQEKLNQPYPRMLLHEHDDGPRVRRRLRVV